MPGNTSVKNFLGIVYLIAIPEYLSLLFTMTKVKLMDYLYFAIGINPKPFAGYQLKA